MEKQITVYGIVDTNTGDVRGVCADKARAHSDLHFYSSHNPLGEYEVVEMKATYTLPKKLVTKTKTMWVGDSGVRFIEQNRVMSAHFNSTSTDDYKHEVTITYQVEE